MKLRQCSKNQRGNATLFVLAIVPLALSMSVLAVDVSRFQSLRERAQKEADRIALQAAKALPDQSLAHDIVRRNVEAIADLTIAKNATGEELLFTDPHSITVGLAGSSEAVFDSFLPQEQFFSFQEIATAARVPQDLVIIMADGHSLRPTARESWGASIDWPASGYFRFVSNPRPQGIPAAVTAEEGVYWPHWWNEWESEGYQRWATQSCFNPIFSSLKLATISLLDRVSAFSNSRAALIFSPGDDARLGYAVSRKLSLFQPMRAEARWFSTMELQTFFGDETCLLFSHPQTSADSRYQSPQRAEHSPSLVRVANRCADIFRTTGWGGLWYPSGHLEDCFLEEKLSLREAVYYRASRSTELPVDGSHILAALDEAVAELAAQPNADEYTVRGNLALTPVRKIVILTDSLPRADSEGFQRIHSQIKSLQAHVLVVSFRHSGLSELRERLLIEAEESFTQLDSNFVRLLAIQNESDLLSGELMEQFQRAEEYVVRR